MNQRHATTTRIAVRFVLTFVLFAGALFGSAGTLRWPQAWVYLVLQWAASTGLVVWLRRHDPELLDDRLKFMKSTVRGWDRALMLIMTAIFVPLLILPGLDFRYGWSRVPLWLQLLAYAALMAALYLMFAVMRVNTYLSRVVEIQKDRGHRVVSTGPYARVRHPMYVAACTLYLCVPLVLGSYVALVPGVLEVALFVLRTALEDRLLHNELDGYREYAQKVRYRLIPGVW